MKRDAEYRFPVSKRRPPLEERGILRIQTAEENLPGEFNGTSVDSKEEARIGVGLYILGWDFEYQVPVFGGTSLRGGQVIDFLVETVPLPRPLYVQSSYWHHPTKAPDDRLNVYLVRSRMKHYWGAPAEIWDWQARSVEEAVVNLQALFGRPG